jgi:hypothetical protein
MAHEGVRGLGTFFRELKKFQKRASSTVERVERQMVRKKIQAAAPRKPSAWWRRG